MSRIAVAILTGLFIPLMAGQSPLHAQISEDEAVQYIQEIPVSRLESGLPNQPFGEWVASISGPETKLYWEINDCGEPSGDPAVDDDRDLPVCVSVDGELADGRNIVVSILVGTWEQGLVGKPTVQDIYWAEEQVVHPLRRLSELPAVVRSRPDEYPD